MMYRPPMCAAAVIIRLHKPLLVLVFSLNLHEMACIRSRYAQHVAPARLRIPQHHFSPMPVLKWDHSIAGHATSTGPACGVVFKLGLQQTTRVCICFTTRLVAAACMCKTQSMLTSSLPAGPDNRSLHGNCCHTSGCTTPKRVSLVLQACG